MKVGLIAYHKNANKIYPKRWIDEFRESILNQTYKEYVIYEVCYGEDSFRIFENSIYECKPMPTFIHTMNYLIEKALADGCDCLGNLNVDDKYSPDWLEVELPYIESGFDLVSCNFCLLQDDKIVKFHRFENMDIQHELNKNHNPLCHPAILYSKKYLENNRYIPEEFPIEDMLLWKRTIGQYKFKIVEQNLLFHRLHENSVCKSENR